MPVYRIEREMPASELNEWYAHFVLTGEEREKEAARQRRLKGGL